MDQNKYRKLVGGNQNIQVRKQNCVIRNFLERMSSATENIFHQAREVDGRSISSVRKFARTIHMAAVRVQRSRSQSEFIDQMITWYGECADGYIAPQLENPIAQSNISDFMIAVVTAGLLLIPNSDDLVNRVACFCNSQVFDTLIITIDPNQFQDRLSTTVQGFLRIIYLQNDGQHYLARFR